MYAACYHAILVYEDTPERHGSRRGAMKRKEGWGRWFGRRNRLGKGSQRDPQPATVFPHSFVVIDTIVIIREQAG